MARGAVDSEHPLQGEMEEGLRVAGTRIAQLERQLENERARREAGEIDSGRMEVLQEENARLLRNEEDLLLLVLDMESQIDRLA